VNPKTLSAVATVILVLAIVFLGLQQGLLATTPLSIALQVAVALLMIWARLTFGLRSFHATANPTEGGLVTSGPYALVRHPIYTALLLFAWTGVAVNFTWLRFAVGLVITAMLLTRMLLEERLLLPKYPEYADYSRRTSRVVPYVF
jgi:protein-S-isoprenylcysteine O-methyltransferase Ste14